jgi:hypothetical protein
MGRVGKHNSAMPADRIRTPNQKETRTQKHHLAIFNHPKLKKKKTPRLEAHEDDVDLGAGLEGFEHAAALFHGHVAHQLHRLQTQLLQPELAQVDHAVVLREHLAQ